MAKARKPTTYELLGRRIQEEVMAANRCEKRQVHLQPKDGDRSPGYPCLVVAF